jgi:glutamine amidotransferase
MAVLASCAAELRVLGTANFLYSDGDTLFAHGDRRQNGSTRKVGPPGLVLLRRYCSLDSSDGMAPGISIEG